MRSFKSRAIFNPKNSLRAASFCYEIFLEDNQNLTWYTIHYTFRNFYIQIVILVIWGIGRDDDTF